MMTVMLQKFRCLVQIHSAQTGRKNIAGRLTCYFFTFATGRLGFDSYDYLSPFAFATWQVAPTPTATRQKVSVTQKISESAAPD